MINLENVGNRRIMLHSLALRSKAALAYRCLVGRWINPLRVKDPSRLVNALYRAAFGRLPEPESHAGRVRQLRSGMSVNCLVRELVRSEEFQARHGIVDTVDGIYIKALYRDGLGRQPDPESLALWLSLGARGATRAKVLAAFCTSKEALEKAKIPNVDLYGPGEAEALVNALYRTAFGRKAETATLTGCVESLKSGISLETLAVRLADSDEFKARHGSGLAIDLGFFRSLYHDGFRREPDVEGLAQWLGSVDEGTTRASVLAAFSSSREALEKSRSPAANMPEINNSAMLLKSLYRTAFGRGIDPPRFASYIFRLQSGVSLEIIASELVDSGEFRTRHGASGTPGAQYVVALYNAGLGREPDDEALARWLALALRGTTCATILAAIGASAEALENLPETVDPGGLVKSLYRTAYGRDVDPSGLANFVRRFESGVPLEIVASELVDSVEFRARHGSSPEIDVAYVSALYSDGFGHQPDLKTLIYWLAERKSGTTRANVLTAIAGSDEALQSRRQSKLGSAAAYEQWVRVNDTISQPDRVAIRAHIAGLPLRPLISVILFPGKYNETELRKSFESILAQLYPLWELPLPCDAATEWRWKTILGEGTTNDRRVRLTRVETLEHIAARTNKAMSLAKGEFVAFLRVGDLLPEQALYEVALEIGANPGSDVIYSDQDQVDSTGRRRNPWFKPGWDPDLLLACEYIGSLVVYRRALLEQIGFFRKSIEGIDFHDLALRATAATSPDRVRHIPAILYHQLVAEEAIRSENAPPNLQAMNASHRAVRDHLDSCGYTGAVLEPAPRIPEAIRVVWPVPEPEPIVSIIILTRDRADLLAKCVDGVLRRTDYSNLELLIVDNGSVETTTLALFDRLTGEDSRVRVLSQSGPFNYSALNNAAARQATGEILLLLNNDIDVIDSGWMREMISQAVRPDVGIVGAKLIYTNELVQHAGMVLGPNGHSAHLYRFASKNDPGYFGQLALPRTLSAVTGACVAIRRAVYFEVGGLDEINLPVTYNDVDLCLRLGDFGYRVVWTPFAELFHVESATRGLDGEDPCKRQRTLREWQYMRATWGLKLESTDPFYNPNLLFHPDYSEILFSGRRQKPWQFIAEHHLMLESIFAPSKPASIETTINERT